jgi:hypothetical protein
MLIAHKSAQILAELQWSNSTSSTDLARSRWTDYEDDEGWWVAPRPSARISKTLAMLGGD